jgi:hypothetical protein
MLALRNSGNIRALKSAVDAMLAYQYADGGWGMHGKSTTTLAKIAATLDQVTSAATGPNLWFLTTTDYDQLWF